ncbi:MAG: hypothetical protein ABI769_04985 [Pseudomonadota bacterium]
MRKTIFAMLMSCTLVPVFAGADDAEEQDVVREIGAALAWRLGPEAVADRCQSSDPEGIDVRRNALKAWLEKYAALIKAVDESVAEVVPLIYKPPANVDAVQAVRAQVKAILLEPIFDGKGAAESTAICKAEADPASPRWNNPGMPNVQQSLAALYDWKTRQTAK